MQQHTTLYLKYRPQTFEELEGQQFIKQTLKNASQHNAMSHAYLFCGPRGTGKTSSARIVAKALCCETKLPDGNPCGTCELCREITSGSLTDVIEIDAASHRGIDDIRQMRERVRFAPNKASKKVYIIDEVHMLTKDASNALLKTLEEPPAHVHFILATTEYQKILPTVLSRCQVFHFLPFSDEELSRRLQYILKTEEILYEEDALDPIIQAANGGMRDALSILEKVLFTGDTLTNTKVKSALGVENSDSWSTLASIIETKNAEQLLSHLDGFWRDGKPGEAVVKEFLLFLRTELRIHAVKGTDKVPHLLHMVKVLEEAAQHMRKSLYPELTCERVFLDMMYPQVQVVAASPVAPVKIDATPLAQMPTPQPEITPSPVVKKTLLTPAQTTQVTPSSLPEEASVASHSSPQSHTATMAAAVHEREENVPLTMTAIRRDWEAFSTTIPGTIVRLTVKDHLRPFELKENTLSLTCTSDFHKAILAKREHQQLIQSAFQTFYRAEITLIFPGEAGAPTKPLPKPVIKKDPTPQPSSAPAQAPMDLDKIADFFGGSIT